MARIVFAWVVLAGLIVVVWDVVAEVVVGIDVVAGFVVASSWVDIVVAGVVVDVVVIPRLLVFLRLVLLGVNVAKFVDISFFLFLVSVWQTGMEDGVQDPSASHTAYFMSVSKKYQLSI